MQGRVCQIRERETENDYAAKIYVSHDEEKISMIKNEAKILSSISHPNIIKFIKFYSLEEDGIFIIINEFFPFISLESFITNYETSPSQKLFITKILINIVSYLQNNNITHGDFNLSNLLINPEDLEIKLIDFGLSKKQLIEIDFQSPKGFFFYRPPLQIFYQSDLYDIWGLILVLMSIFLNQKLYSKSLIKVFEELESKNKETDENLLCLIKIFKGALIGPTKAENLKESIKIMETLLSKKES